MQGLLWGLIFWKLDIFWGRVCKFSVFFSFVISYRILRKNVLIFAVIRQKSPNFLKTRNLILFFVKISLTEHFQAFFLIVTCPKIDTEFCVSGTKNARFIHVF